MLSRTQRVAFIVSEDWFFVSHFIPMLRAAQRAGLEPVIITRVSSHLQKLNSLGARVIPLNVERRNIGPFSVASTVFKMARILKAERIDIVHCIALRSIVIGSLAAKLAGIKNCLFAITGGGLLTADNKLGTDISRLLLRNLIRLIAWNGNNHFVFENVTDPLSFGFLPDATNVTVVPGAGVDPDYYAPVFRSGGTALKIAMVSRMVWSKGADLAVEAVSIARQRGHDIQLSLYGNPDPSNPRALSQETLLRWSQRPGIEWHGASKDVREVWAIHDLACLPTRGGEGLPRSILEAGACGRAIVTTDVAGCRDFVRDGIEGWLVPPNDPLALAERICVLASAPELVAEAGRSARERILSGYTERHVIDQIERLYYRVSNNIF